MKYFACLLSVFLLSQQIFIPPVLAQSLSSSGAKTRAIKPGSAEFYLEQGMKEVERGEYGDKDKALEIFNLTLERNPHLAQTYLGRGQIYLRLRQEQKAIEDFDRSIDPRK